VSQRSNDYFARNGRLQRIKCAPARAEDRARAGGTPDSLQDLSGAPPDSQEGPQVRAPTVGTQRPGDVAGAPDCPVSPRSNDYFARNGRLQRIKCAPARAEDRARAGCTPDSLHDLSGAPPDSQTGPQVRAPTVGTQRPGDVAGAPDTVRWRTGLSGAPCDSSIHQTASLVVGAINTPTTPHSSHPSFPLQLLTRALAFNSRHTQVIKSSLNSTQHFSD
jgi:hypothetical protein